MQADDTQHEAVEPMLNDEDSKDDSASWTREQEEYLKSVVMALGTHNWNEIIRTVNSKFPEFKKTKQACRDRWHTKLDPNVNRAPWSKQEEAALILAHMKYVRSLPSPKGLIRVLIPLDSCIDSDRSECI
ncbi:MAG: SANT/Myb-like DNA-binding domain-containing protein, partial [Candidatus Pacebacteria bacterium]|nr:SANT/Myb-like DNA-binding domain-containing protein [Candidatus Paceibacterota bacterium]